LDRQKKSGLDGSVVWITCRTFGSDGLAAAVLV
jgi:hypothetical protein